MKVVIRRKVTANIGQVWRYNAQLFLITWNPEGEVYEAVCLRTFIVKYNSGDINNLLPVQKGTYLDALEVVEGE